MPEQQRLLVGLGPEHLVAGTERCGGVRAVEHVGQRAEAVDLHDLDLRPGPCQPLADQGVAVAPAAPRLAQDLVELLLEAPVAGGRRRAALEPERRHGNLPPVVHATDDVVLGAAHVGEEDLVELGRPVHLFDRPHLHPGLLHRDEEVGDPGVLRRVGVGAGQQEDVVGVVRLGRPHLLPVDDPLVAVELGPGLETRPGPSRRRAR